MPVAVEGPPSTNSAERPVAPTERLGSLDAYRGAVMLLLAFFDGPNSWQAPLAAAYAATPWVAGLVAQFEHVEWAGLALWDMIQPSFMFMVGASLAFSDAARIRRGHSFARRFGHAAYRAVLLILLGVFLRSTHALQTNWTFEDVVTQIGLGYVFLFLLSRRDWRLQLAVAATVLFAYWALFALWPLPPAEYDYARFAAHAYYDGFEAHWNKNANPAHYFDRWFLNLFPRPSEFVANSGGYATLSFIPSLATMIVGLMAGELLGSARPWRQKLTWLLLGALAAGGLGAALHVAGVCPLVKRIWTPSFALASAGICLATLATLYAVIDVAGWRRWAVPAVVLGQNPLAAYCLIHLLGPWILAALRRHVAWAGFGPDGAGPQPLLENLAVGVALWLVCYWMYRRRIFLRL